MKTKNKQNVVGKLRGLLLASLASLLCFFSLPLRGQSVAGSDSLLVFRYPPRIQMFKEGYKDNRLTLRKFKKRLRAFRKRHDTLYVYSFSGNWDTEKQNLRTAYWRANNLKGYLINFYGLRERDFKTANHSSAHPSWGEVVLLGFAPLQRDTAGLQQENTEMQPTDINPRQRQKPEEAVVPVADHKDSPVSTETSPDNSTTSSVTTTTTTTTTISTTISSSDSRYLGIQTNLAAWAGTVLNLAADVQVSRHVSIELPVLWCPWYVSNRHAVKTFTLQPEARYWLSRPGTGHFFGIHAHVGWFNVKWDRDRYQDTDRPLLGADISYGYLLPFSKHWAGEFTLGAGYANMRYDTYYNIDNGARIDTRTKNYWGITRVGLSVVYRFNLKK